MMSRPRTKTIFIAILLAITTLLLLVRWPILSTTELSSEPVTSTVKDGERGGGININEFMAANRSTLADEDGDFSDWIKLHNTGSETENLDGWFLTDNPQNLMEWRLPAVELPPDGYLTVFASGKDRGSAASELHTNFKLDSMGEYLALVQPDGLTIASEFAPYPPQLADVSYRSDPENTGPSITSIDHAPDVPQADDTLRVTATIEPSSADVKLHWRIMFDELQTTPMRHIGDARFEAEITAEAFDSSQMVRYFITAVDAEGRMTRAPLFPDSLNSPEYFGVLVTDPAIASQLPVLHWFTDDTESAKTREGARGSLFYGDEFYDNIFVRERGGSSANWPKRQFKVDFNTGEFFQYAPERPPVEEINLNSTWSDKSYVRRILAWDTYRAAGVPALDSFPVRLQRNGEFYEVAHLTEHLDERTLARFGLDPDGALYKLYHTFGSSTEGLRKITRLGDDNTDLQTLIEGVFQKDSETRQAYLLDHLNIPAVLNYLAATVIMQDNDAVAKNYFLYRNTNGNGEWTILPWDKDMTFGRLPTRLFEDNLVADEDPASHPLFGDYAHPKEDGYWNALNEIILSDPVLREMYLRRLRTLMDGLLQAPDTPEEELFFEGRMGVLQSQMDKDVTLDLQRWGDTLWYGEPQDFETALNMLKTDYLDKRRLHLFETHGPANGGIIPAAQAEDIAIEFGDMEAMPASGKLAEAYFTLVNNNDSAIDISNWRVKGDVEYVFQPGVVIPAGYTLYVSPDVVAFRGRARSPSGGEGHFIQGNYSGQLSPTRSQLHLNNATRDLVAQIDFSAGAYVPGPLIVSEVHYHPADDEAIPGDDFEFIELQNIGNQDLDLSGYRLTDGVEFTFPAGSVLGSGKGVVLVRNPAAFSLRYPDAAVGGVYSGKLRNSRDVITILATDGAIVTSFEYLDEYPWPVRADGQGFTLVRLKPKGDPNDAASWRSSAMRGGSPGHRGMRLFTDGLDIHFGDGGPDMFEIC